MRLERSLRAGSRAMIYSLLVLYAAITLFPFFLSLVSSFKDLRELYASALALPGVWRWENYRIAWIQGNFSLYFKNSVYVTGLSIVGVLLIGSMASYILARSLSLSALSASLASSFLNPFSPGNSIKALASASNAEDGSSRSPSNTLALSIILFLRASPVSSSAILPSISAYSLYIPAA